MPVAADVLEVRAPLSDSLLGVFTCGWLTDLSAPASAPVVVEQLVADGETASARNQVAKPPTSIPTRDDDVEDAEGSSEFNGDAPRAGGASTLGVIASMLVRSAFGDTGDGSSTDPPPGSGGEYGSPEPPPPTDSGGSSGSSDSGSGDGGSTPSSPEPPPPGNPPTGDPPPPLFNLPPQFDMGPPTFQVAENSPSGTYLGTVTAHDPDGDPITYAINGSPSSVVEIDSQTGVLTAGPLDYEMQSTLSFNVTATDSHGGVAMLGVTVEVLNVNEAPQANDFSATTQEDQPVTVDVRAWAMDPDGDALAISSVGNAANGTVQVDDRGTSDAFDDLAVFTPEAGYWGAASFEYVVRDGSLESNVATVSIMVSAVNAPPMAAPDEYSTLDTDVLTVSAAEGVLANDHDPDGDMLTVELVTGPEHATSFSLNTDGSFDYTPTEGHAGWDSFWYRVFDGMVFGAPVAARVGVSRIVIEDGVLRPGTDGSRLDDYDWTDHGGSVVERWIGEFVILRVQTVGPRPPAIASYQWTIPGIPIHDFIVSTDQEHGHPDPVRPDELRGSGVFFGWVDPSVGTRTVSVDVTLQNGGVKTRTAKFIVRKPTQDVTAEAGQLRWVPAGPENPFAVEYTLGDANHAGIEIAVTEILAPPGEYKWAQLISHNAVAYLARGTLGPGPYIRACHGLDKGYPLPPGVGRPNVFVDYPSAAMRIDEAGPGGYLEVDNYFHTYLMWRSDRSMSFDVPLKWVDWSWRFAAVARTNDAGGWEWGPTYRNAVTVGQPASTTSYPEWDHRCDLEQLFWQPQG